MAAASGLTSSRQAPDARPFPPRLTAGAGRLVRLAAIAVLCSGVMPAIAAAADAVPLLRWTKVGVVENTDFTIKHRATRIGLYGQLQVAADAPLAAVILAVDDLHTDGAEKGNELRSLMTGALNRWAGETHRWPVQRVLSGGTTQVTAMLNINQLPDVVAGGRLRLHRLLVTEKESIDLPLQMNPDQAPPWVGSGETQLQVASHRSRPGGYEVTFRYRGVPPFSLSRVSRTPFCFRFVALDKGGKELPQTEPPAHSSLRGVDAVRLTLKSGPGGRAAQPHALRVVLATETREEVAAVKLPRLELRAKPKKAQPTAAPNPSPPSDDFSVRWDNLGQGTTVGLQGADDRETFHRFSLSGRLFAKKSDIIGVEGPTITHVMDRDGVNVFDPRGWRSRDRARPVSMGDEQGSYLAVANVPLKQAPGQIESIHGHVTVLRAQVIATQRSDGIKPGTKFAIGTEKGEKLGELEVTESRTLRGYLQVTLSYDLPREIVSDMLRLQLRAHWEAKGQGASDAPYAQRRQASAPNPKGEAGDRAKGRIYLSFQQRSRDWKPVGIEATVLSRPKEAQHKFSLELHK